MVSFAAPSHVCVVCSDFKSARVIRTLVSKIFKDCSFHECVKHSLNLIYLFIQTVYDVKFVTRDRWS